MSVWVALENNELHDWKEKVRQAEAKLQAETGFHTMPKEVLEITTGHKKLIFSRVNLLAWIKEGIEERITDRMSSNIRDNFLNLWLSVAQWHSCRRGWVLQGKCTPITKPWSPQMSLILQSYREEGELQKIVPTFPTPHPTPKSFMNPFCSNHSSCATGYGWLNSNTIERTNVSVVNTKTWQ